jgi:hypothetical protein
VSSIGYDLQRLLIEERAAHERTKAELAEARTTQGMQLSVIKAHEAEIEFQRAAHERTKAERESAHAFAASAQRETRDVIESLKRANAERDAAQAKLASVEADAAAMRLAIEDEVIGDGWPEDFPSCVSAIAGIAGRAIAARVPLLEAVATAAHRYWHGLSGDIGSHDQMERALRALATFDEEGGA